MSKKDYIKLAQALKDSKPEVLEEDDFNTFDYAYSVSVHKMAQWNQNVENICHVLESDNPRFIPSRFYIACGYSA